MKAFFKNHSRALKQITVICMVLVSFGLYFAALKNLTVLVHILLAAMGLTMLLAMTLG